jgi:hypothetical protein
MKEKIKDFADSISEESEFEIIYNQILLNELNFKSKIKIYLSGIFIGTEGDLNKISLEETMKWFEESEQYEKCSILRDKIKELKKENKI